jgi:hypothetical protein
MHIFKFCFIFQSVNCKLFFSFYFSFSFLHFSVLVSVSVNRFGYSLQCLGNVARLKKRGMLAFEHVMLAGLTKLDKCCRLSCIAGFMCISPGVQFSGGSVLRGFSSPEVQFSGGSVLRGFRGCNRQQKSTSSLFI